MGRLKDYRLFWGEFRRTFKTTGAVLPSGRALARALSRHVRTQNGVGRRILEVGPGTGAVTEQIARSMGPADSLDVVELNDRFVQRLRQRFASEDVFRNVGERMELFHLNVEDHAVDAPYDIVVSGLPLNNFGVDDVERILAALVKLLRTGGTLSFFEYVAVRNAKAVVSRASERERLRGIGRAMSTLFDQHQVDRQWVLPNVPPAWVHHVEKIAG
jgi:phospholipid N-methyltransferase